MVRQTIDAQLKKQGVPRAERRRLLYTRTVVNPGKPMTRQFPIAAMARAFIQEQTNANAK